jgi:hypothetical protein
VKVTSAAMPAQTRGRMNRLMGELLRRNISEPGPGQKLECV